MKKLIACLAILTLTASCTSFGLSKASSAEKEPNKYSATKESDAKNAVVEAKKVTKKKAKKHGGSEVK